jgi:voltage-gated potassium channel
VPDDVQGGRGTGGTVVEELASAGTKPWLLWVRVALRVAVSVAVLLALFYLVPLDAQLDAKPIVGLAIGLAVVALLIWWVVRSILRSDSPTLRGIEAVSVTIPLLLVCFASAYYLIARNSPAAFTEGLTRTDSLYFTTTVFSTVGFGDISPHSQSARLVVTGQMAIDLVVVGIGARIILGAVQVARQRKTTPTNEHSSPT